MKKQIMFLLVLLFLFQFCDAAKKHALIVAIGNYPNGCGWRKLASLNDAGLLKKTFEKQGFDAIKIIRDSEATVAGIRDALEQLIDECGKGDKVILHVSSHGHQLGSTDPSKPGGNDQCIVTINAKYPLEDSIWEEQQKEYMRGQELGRYIVRLRNKLGKDGDLMVLLDYCHSGSGTKGGPNGTVRGGYPESDPPGFVAKQYKAGGTDLFAGRPKIDEGELSAYTVLSACRPEELDYEIQDDSGKSVGSLTFSVCKAFDNLDSSLTYSAFSAKVAQIMSERNPATSKRQHPLLEGNEKSRALLGGKYFVQKPYYAIYSVDERRNQIVVNAGILAGFGNGAKVSIARAGTLDPESSGRLGDGTVINSNRFFATVQLNQKLSLISPASAWVFIKNPVYVSSVINIKIVRQENSSGGAVAIRGDNLGFSNTEAEKIKNNLSKLYSVSFNGKPELLIKKGAQGTDSILRAPEGELFDTVADVLSNTEAISKKIETYIKYKSIADLDLKQPGIKFDIRLFASFNGILDTAREIPKMKGHYLVKAGEEIGILIKNTGEREACINILNLEPNGVIDCLLPNSQYERDVQYQYKPWDLRFFPGRSLKYSIRINKYLYGTKILKVFTSENEIDFENLATPVSLDNGNTKGGRPEQFSQIQSQPLPSSKCNTQSIIYEVLP